MKNKLGVFLCTIWIAIGVVIYKLPSIMGDSFTIEKGKKVLLLYVVLAPIIGMINGRCRKASKEKRKNVVE